MLGLSPPERTWVVDRSAPPELLFHRPRCFTMPMPSQNHPPARVLGLFVVLGLTACSSDGTGPNGSDPLVLLWPVAGEDGADWVINNYVDLDTGAGVLDYRGGGKSYDGHPGVDIDVPNFRWMDSGHQIVAAHAGEVVFLGDGQPDRNTSCVGTANFVDVRHEDGSTMTYAHLKQSSIVVTIGQQVSAGDALAVVGSSGCSTAPHLHLELRDEGGTVVDPFLEELFAAPPTYDAPFDFMDLNVKEGAIGGIDELKDPPPNATTVAGGGTIGVGLSMAGGTTGDVIRVLILDDGDVVVHDVGTTFQRTRRHTYWFWNRSLTAGTPGSWAIEVYTNGALRATYGFTVQ